MYSQASSVSRPIVLLRIRRPGQVDLEQQAVVMDMGTGSDLVLARTRSHPWRWHIYRQGTEWPYRSLYVAEKETQARTQLKAARRNPAALTETPAQQHGASRGLQVMVGQLADSPL